VQVLVAWFEDPDEAEVLGELPEGTLAASWDDVPEVDWENSWKEGFGPVRISDTLTIAPPWDAPPGALVIEPGQGFGTGLHPSTQGALRLMEPLLSRVSSCLDVGSGSGVLALTAARHGLVARGIDVDAAAVRDAEGNAARNDLVVPFSTTPISEVANVSDLVLANLHAELLRELASELARVTGRYLVTAGVLLDREALAVDALMPWFTLVAREEADNAWVAHVWERRG
jgi:ribosomal protein L11 methyltransferase